MTTSNTGEDVLVGLTGLFAGLQDERGDSPQLLTLGLSEKCDDGGQTAALHQVSLVFLCSEREWTETLVNWEICCKRLDFYLAHSQCWGSYF